MKDMKFQSERVLTEGDELFYEVRGSGKPLIMIPAAGGDGDYYLKMADILSDEYKVIIYDRRACVRSTANEPQNFEMSQQSRDIVAVLEAVGETSAYVFGNSSGAAIALDLAKTQPQAVRAVIAHEPASPGVLPNSEKYKRFFAKCYLTAFRFGSYIAAARFMFGAHIAAMQIAKSQRIAIEYAKAQRENWEKVHLSNQKQSTGFLVKQELLPVTNYVPDIKRIMENNVKVFIGAGEWALKHNTWNAKACKIISEKLGTKLIHFPGHHGSYFDQPEAFAKIVRETFSMVE